jgi:hypothetical protein
VVRMRSTASRSFRTSSGMRWNASLPSPKGRPGAWRRTASPSGTVKMRSYVV